MVSSISQVIRKRIDQTRPVLFLIWGGKDLRGYQEVDDWQICSSVPALSGIGNSQDSSRWDVTFQMAMKLHQILVDCLRLLPLLE